MTDQKTTDLGDAVDQLENDFDAFFEFLTTGQDEFNCPLPDPMPVRA
jgi:hypothetical protein